MSSFLTSGDLSADRRYLWAEASLADGDAQGAADIFVQALELVPGWAAGWFALGNALARAGDTPGAIVAFRTCLVHAPDDPFGAGLRRAQLGKEVAPTTMPGHFVAQLFDDYAARFDDHLTRALHYCGPAVLMAALAAACTQLGRRRDFDQVLDLGCGTGLMAVALADHAGAVDGVDLSRAMLERAEITGLYRMLEAGDVTAFLNKNTRPAYDLVIAADVFGYVGDLDLVIAAAARRLAPGGLLAFTVQHREGAGYMLGSDMRFAHSTEYVGAVAASCGLRIVYDQPVIARQDAGVDVPGRVVVLVSM